MKRLLIVGAGGHGKVVAEMAKACGYTVAFLDDKAGDGVVGTLEDVKTIASQYDGAIISLGNNKKRQELMSQISNPVTLVHPRAYVSPSAIIGEGSIILPGAVVHTNAKIGRGCIISIGALVDHDSQIGDYCHINTGAIVGAGAKVVCGTRVSAGTVV